MSSVPPSAGGSGDDNLPPPEHEIHANSVYPRIPLPTLVDGAAEAYFMSLEFWFAASGVTSDARKYCTVLAQVPSTKLQELSTIITAAPVNGKYEYIKAALIKHFADSQTRRLQRVLSEMPLGDKKPSQLYHDMARVAGTSLGETALRDLWAARLPPFTQAAVVAAKGTLADCLDTADRVHESIGLRQHQVAGVEPEASTNPDLIRLIKQIDETFRRFREDFPHERNGRGRTRDGSQNRNQNRERSFSRRRGQSNDNDHTDLCWYHAEFGRRAKKCREPCTWTRTTSTNSTTPALQTNGAANTTA